MLGIYTQLTKFGIVIFVLITGVAGYATGFLVENEFSVKHFSYFILGLYFLSSGSLALNQVQEYKRDQKMKRTEKRPIASGRLKPLAGAILAFTMIFVGVGVLSELSLTAGILSLTSVVLYNGLYTMWWKPKWAFGAVPGALPGAFPVAIGYAVNNPNIFNSEFLYLFLIMFLWQMPHFWVIAIKFMEDYRKAGFPTLPVTIGVERTIFHIGLYTFVYAGVAIASPFFTNASWMYALIVIPFAFMLLKSYFTYYNSQGQKGWFPFFMWTNVSLLIFVYIPVIDKWSFLFIGRS